MDVEGTIEFLLEQQAAQQARFDARMESLSARVADMSRAITSVQHQLHRAVKLRVEEARRERAQRRALEQKVDSPVGELATAQLTTERSLQRLIDSLQQLHNGYDRT